MLVATWVGAHVANMSYTDTGSFRFNIWAFWTQSQFPRRCQGLKPSKGLLTPQRLATGTSLFDTFELVTVMVGKAWYGSIRCGRRRSHSRRGSSVTVVKDKGVPVAVGSLGRPTQSRPWALAHHTTAAAPTSSTAHGGGHTQSHGHAS